MKKSSSIFFLLLIQIAVLACSGGGKSSEAANDSASTDSLRSAQKAYNPDTVYLNYRLFISGELTYEWRLFNPANIFEARGRSVHIVITDSSNLSNVSKGKYSENMDCYFNYQFMIDSANYSITHPRLSLQMHSGFILDGTSYLSEYFIESLKDPAHQKLKYTPQTFFINKEFSDNVLEQVGEWEWNFPSDSIHRSLTDTSTELVSSTYDRYGFEQYHALQKTYYGPLKKSGFTEIQNKLLKSSGDTLVLATTRRDSLSQVDQRVSTYTTTETHSNGLITSRVVSNGGQIISQEQWKSDREGNLLYYSKKSNDENYSFEVIRGENKLPLKVIYKSDRPTVTFDFVWAYYPPYDDK